MSAVDTAYEMWGVAQPGIPKTKPVKYLTHDCHKLEILTSNQLRTIISVLEQSPDSQYRDYWITYYRTQYKRRTKHELQTNTSNNSPEPL